MKMRNIGSDLTPTVVIFSIRCSYISMISISYQLSQFYGFVLLSFPTCLSVFGSHPLDPDQQLTDWSPTALSILNSTVSLLRVAWLSRTQTTVFPFVFSHRIFLPPSSGILAPYTSISIILSKPIRFSSWWYAIGIVKCSGHHQAANGCLASDEFWRLSQRK